MHFFLLHVFCLSIIIIFIIITFSDTQRLGGPTNFETNNKLYRFIRENNFTLKPLRVNLGSFTLALKWRCHIAQKGLLSLISLHGVGF